MSPPPGFTPALPCPALPCPALPCLWSPSDRFSDGCKFLVNDRPTAGGKLARVGKLLACPRGLATGALREAGRDGGKQR